jgi:3-phenylpropionate/cinnamic acid dioxygenase small subunit
MEVSEKDLINFVYHEARLLDQRDFLKWVDLFTEDAIYWMPLEWDQEE